MGGHAYPKELAATAWERWRELERLSDPGPCETRGGALPDRERLEALLSVAYQASLLHEEDRPVRFRLYVGEPELIPDGDGPPSGLHRLRFGETRAYDEGELRRLAAAAKYHRALIGVALRGDAFRIWGIVQSGPRWLESARGGRALASPVPSDAIVVRVVDAGHVIVMVGDVKLGELRTGRIEASSLNVFDAPWLRVQFAAWRSEVAAMHKARMNGEGATLDPDGVRIVSQQLVKRALATVRDGHHGGTFLYVPSEHAPRLLREAIHVKYPFVDDPSRRRYQTLLLDVMRELALAGNDAPRAERVGWEHYRRTARKSIALLDEAIAEMSHLLAGLADVDGAVLLTDRLEVLGFGAEIVGPLPDVTTIRRAHDLAGTSFDEVRIDGVGTRHRSAYRLCAYEPGCLAIVMSHDGGVQFVKSLDGALTFWEQGEALI